MMIKEVISNEDSGITPVEENEVPLISTKNIESSIEIKKLIYTIRNKQVMLDSDLAMLYDLETKNLNKAMKRNIDRFPEDFCFKLKKEELD